MIISLLVACCCATLSSVVFAMIGGSLTHTNAILALIIGALAGIGSFRRTSTDRLPINTVNALVLTIFTLFALRAFCWLIFFNEDEIRVLSPNNLGDLSLHLTYINYLANGAHFWPDNPIFAGAPMHYPIGIDLFNALLSLAGLDVMRGLVWVGLGGSVVTAVALWRWGKGFTLAGFLFNGGLTGFHYFEHFRFTDYNDTVAWKSIPLSMFVTQRGLLYAVPVGLLLLTSWREKWFTSESENLRLPFWVELLLFSTLPLFHLHTFLFLGVLLLVWVIANAGRSRLAAAKLLACSFVPATALIVLVTGVLHHGVARVGSLIHLTPGWMQGKEPFLQFWFMNFGALPIFIAVLIVFAVRGAKTDKTAVAFVFPSVIVFLIACFVMLATWEWDNTKIMIWCYLALLPFLWELVVRKLPWAGQTSACFLLFFSGFVSLIGGSDRSHQGYDIASRTELDGVKHAVRGFDPDVTFAAYPTYNHPLSLCGNKLVEGYDGHLLSHGFDYQPQLKKLTSLMEGETNWRDLARDLQVHYLFWGRREQEHYPKSTTPWRANCQLVASGSWGEIYDLSK